MSVMKKILIFFVMIFLGTLAHSEDKKDKDDILLIDIPKEPKNEPKIEAQAVPQKDLSPSIDELLEQLNESYQLTNTIEHNAKTVLSAIEFFINEKDEIFTEGDVPFRFIPYFNYHQIEFDSNHDNQLVWIDTIDSFMTQIAGEMYLADHQYSIYFDMPLISSYYYENETNNIDFSIPVFSNEYLDKIECEDGILLIETDKDIQGIKEIELFYSNHNNKAILPKKFIRPDTLSQLYLYCGIPSGPLKIRYVFDDKSTWDKNTVIHDDGLRYEYAIFHNGKADSYDISIEYPLATEMIPLLEDISVNPSFQIYNGSGSFDVIFPFTYFSTPRILQGDQNTWVLAMDDMPLFITPRSSQILLPSNDYLDIVMRDRLGILDLESKCVIQMNLNQSIDEFHFNHEDNANIIFDQYYLDKNGRLFPFSEINNFREIADLNKIFIIGQLAGQMSGIISWKWEYNGISHYGQQVCHSQSYFIEQY